MSGYIGPAPVPQATQTRETFTATSGQTSFATAGYTVGFLDVYLNGVHLVDGDDYTASNGSDVVLSSGATAGDILEVVAYKPFEVVDQNFTGDFSVDTDTLFVDASTDSVGINNASPSSSLDVTGDAKVSGDLTVDTDTLYVDSASNQVGIGTSSPSHRLEVSGNDNSSAAAFIQNLGTGLGSAGLEIGTHAATTETDLAFSGNAVIGVDASLSIALGSASAFKIFTGATNRLYGIDGASEAMRIDSSGRVGIGTSNPSTTLDVNGSLSKNSGSFKIDHPVKPDTHHLVHSFVEGPQADNLYRGKVTLVDGLATVNLDEAGRMTEGTFVALNGNVQCWTTNEDGWTQVRGKVEGNTLTIEAQDPACTDEVSWLVIGERHDQHMMDTEWTDENGRVITEPTKENTQ